MVSYLTLRSSGTRWLGMKLKKAGVDLVGPKHVLEHGWQDHAAANRLLITVRHPVHRAIAKINRGEAPDIPDYNLIHRTFVTHPDAYAFVVDQDPFLRGHEPAALEEWLGQKLDGWSWDLNPKFHREDLWPEIRMWWDRCSYFPTHTRTLHKETAQWLLGFYPGCKWLEGLA